MLLLPILLLILHSASGIDIVVKSVERLNASSPKACDDFYRHNCPVGSENLVRKYYIDEVRQKVKKQYEEERNQYDFINDFKKYRNVWNSKGLYDESEDFPKYTVQSFLDYYQKRCSSGQNLDSLFKHFNTLLSYDDRVRSKVTLEIFKNCTGSSQLILKELKEFSRHFKDLNSVNYDMLAEAHENLTPLMNYTQYALRTRRLELTGAKMIKSDSTILKGVEIVAKMIEDMKDIAIDWLDSTKWVLKNQAVDFLKSFTKKIKMVKNYDDVIEKSEKLLANIDETYKKCKKDIDSVDDVGNAICLLGAFIIPRFKRLNIFEMPVPIILEDQALNRGITSLEFSFTYFIAAVEIEEMAGKIGFLGATLGHEIGHTLQKQERIPFFSKIASKCVFKLFGDTCKEFKEESCVNHIKQEGETSSDILGTQLSYQLFKKYYGNRTQDIYHKLNITNEQLFFHASVVGICDANLSKQKYDRGVLDVHPSDNIRANVIGQIPTFETAFNCSADSRMAKLIEEECHIYGPDAPETRRLKLIK